MSRKDNFVFVYTSLIWNLFLEINNAKTSSTLELQCVPNSLLNIRCVSVLLTLLREN